MGDKLIFFEVKKLHKNGKKNSGNKNFKSGTIPSPSISQYLKKLFNIRLICTGCHMSVHLVFSCSGFFLVSHTCIFSFVDLFYFIFSRIFGKIFFTD